MTISRSPGRPQGRKTGGSNAGMIAAAKAPLLQQIEALEKELDAARKALGVALEALKTCSFDHNGTWYHDDQLTGEAIALIEGLRK